MKIRAFQLIVFLTLSSSWCYAQDDNAKIKELLDKAKKAPSYQCEMISKSFIVGKAKTAPQSSVSKIWHKGQYSKNALDTGVVIINRPDGIYDYELKKDRYSKRPTKGDSSLNELDFLINDKNWELTIIGNDIIDGKSCTKVRAIQRNKETSFSLSSTYWIWNENGLLIRIEHTGQRGSTISKTQSQAKNFVFGDIPDNVFSVPKDKIMDMPEAAK